MAREFLLPDIGSGLQEGEIVAWNVKVGDTVTSDGVLCEVETEKAVVEIPVPFGGVVLALGAAEGESITVGEMLVVIGEGSELETQVAPITNEPTADATPSISAASESGAVEAAGPDEAAPAGDVGLTTRPRAMPLVRKLAKTRGVDLSNLVGTGVGGRITRKDVEDAARAVSESTVSPAAPPVAVSAESERRPMSKMRRTIATHMTAQWQQVPHITGNTDADAGRFLAARRALGERINRKVPFDALIIAAVIPALKRFPEMNATVDGADLVIHHRYDIGIAVGAEGGLMVPVVRNADRYGLAELTDVVADLAARALERKLTPDEMGGQTFTISNIGPVGADHATQIIPAGTTAIASFGRIRETAVVRNGQLAVGSMMAVSGTFDHRAVDGVPAMRFLRTVVDAIEEPALMLL